MHMESDEVRRIRAAYARRDQNLLAPSGELPRYSMFNAAALLRIQEIHFEMIRCLKRFGYSDLSNRKILEIGCGQGHYLRQFVQWGAQPRNVFGVDLLPDRIESARNVCPPAVTLVCEDASRLRFEDESFDLVLEACAFTSIFDPGMARSIAREMVRVLKPGGAVIWYDFWASNPRNPDVRGWSRRQIRELFPALDVYLQRITLAPPIGWVVGNTSAALYRALSSVKLLDTHYLGVLQKPVAPR